jgi:hypothetical protein
MKCSACKLHWLAKQLVVERLNFGLLHQPYDIQLRAVPGAV